MCVTTKSIQCVPKLTTRELWGHKFQPLQLRESTPESVIVGPFNRLITYFLFIKFFIEPYSVMFCEEFMHLWTVNSSTLRYSSSVQAHLNHSWMQTILRPLVSTKKLIVTYTGDWIVQLWLQSWCAWMVNRNESGKLSLQPFVNAIIETSISIKIEG